MRRVLTGVVVLLLATVGVGAARADQTPVGNLGQPSIVAGLTTVGEIKTPTDACPDFAVGGILSFMNVSGELVAKRWFVGPYSDFYWADEMRKLTDSTTAYGYSYVLRASLHRVGMEFAGSSLLEFLGGGSLTITRSDGARMTGDASVLLDEQTQAWVAYWNSVSCT